MTSAPPGNSARSTRRRVSASVRGDVHQPQEDLPDELLPVGRQLRERLLGGLRHAARDAARPRGSRRRSSARPARAATSPAARATAGAAGRPAAPARAGAGRRAGPRPGRPRPSRRPCARVRRWRPAGRCRPSARRRPAPPGRRGRARGIQRAAVEVGAQGDHHRRVERAQRPDERRALVLVDGRAEDLLELVDDQERGRRGRPPDRAGRAAARRESQGRRERRELRREGGERMTRRA